MPPCRTPPIHRLRQALGVLFERPIRSVSFHSRGFCGSRRRLNHRRRLDCIKHLTRFCLVCGRGQVSSRRIGLGRCSLLRRCWRLQTCPQVFWWGCRLAASFRFVRGPARFRLWFRFKVGNDISHAAARCFTGCLEPGVLSPTDGRHRCYSFGSSSLNAKNLSSDQFEIFDVSRFASPHQSRREDRFCTEVV